MQQSHLCNALLALFAFSLVALASPVDGTNELAVSARGASPLADCLNILLDTQVKVSVVLTALAKLDVKADISLLVGQIVAILGACTTAIVNVGVVLDLSDTVQVTAVATVCAQIIVSIQASITVFAAILTNLLAVASLDVAMQALLVSLNLCVSGILTVIAPLCVNITVVGNLSFPLVIALLGL